MFNVVKNQRRGRIQLKYGTFSQHRITLKEQKKMVENNAATVVVDLRNKVFILARIEICNYLVELLQDMSAMGY